MAPTQLPLGVQLRDGNTFDAFHAGPNAELVGLVESCSRGVDPCSLLVVGGAGAGKTHLLQATCRGASVAGLATAYLPLAEVMALSSDILEGLAAVDVLCLDDIHRVAGRRAWELGLMALCDGVRHGGGAVVAASAQAPDELDRALPDFRSRLGWGPVYRLHTLSDADKRALLQLRARRRGMSMGDEVARYLLNRRRRDLPALMRLLDRLDIASLAAQRRLTIPFVRQVLGADAE